MKTNRICAVLLGTVMSISAFAQTPSQPNKYFTKGFYFGVEASGGIVANDRITLSSRNNNYGIDVAAGYRFCPQFVLAAGFGGHAYTSSSTTVDGGPMQTNFTTSVPVFLRLRSDFMDRKVTPYAQLDLGYSFVFLYSRDAGQKIKYNDKVFMDRVEEMGFASLDLYEEYFRSQYDDKTSQAVDALWNAELSRLKQFTNGSREYIPLSDLHQQYGKNGAFATLDIGVSWAVGERGRMNAGISAGLSQSFYGTCLRTIDNQFLDFGREDYLPYDKSEEKVYVRTLGQRDFKDSFELDLKVKIGFSF